MSKKQHLGAIDNNNLVDKVTAWQVTVHKIIMQTKLLEKGVKVEICTCIEQSKHTKHEKATYSFRLYH